MNFIREVLFQIHSGQGLPGSGSEMIYSGSDSGSCKKFYPTGSGSGSDSGSTTLIIHFFKNVAKYSSVDLVTIYKASKISETSIGTVDPDPELFGIVDTGTFYTLSKTGLDLLDIIIFEVYAIFSFENGQIQGFGSALI